MKILSNKALLLNVRDPDRITTVIPKSKVVARKPGGAQVAVHWGLDEARVLKNLGVKNVPSPIRGRYSWPGLYTPYAHQRETSEFLTMHKRAFCFNEQGTGKSASVAWAADYLMDIGKVKRALIICPLSIMESAWLNDLFRVVMHRSVTVAHHRNGERRREIIRESVADFMIINYDGIELALDELEACQFDLIVVDEANGYKNPSTARWKALHKLVKPETLLWMMTGTPAAQSPADAYGLARLVNPSAVPRYQNAFKDLVMYKVTQFRWVPKPTAAATVHQVLQPAIRFTKEECLDLPAMSYTSRHVPLSKQQEKYYNLLKNQFIAQAVGEDITAVNAAANINKLLQISGGAVYADSGDTIHFDVSNRLHALKEVIEEASHKVLVFVPYTHTIHLVKEYLDKSGIPAEVINGAVPVTKRTDIFNDFQTKDNIRVLVIQPQAASHGVTLHAANTIVYWSPVNSVETYLQCNARVDRVGQLNPTLVIHLEGSVVERKTYANLQNNITEHTKVIDLYKEVLG